MALLVDVLLICKHAMQISEFLVFAPGMTHPARFQVRMGAVTVMTVRVITAVSWFEVPVGLETGADAQLPIRPSCVNPARNHIAQSNFALLCFQDMH